MVPELVAGEDLDEADTALDQAAGDEATAAIVARGRVVQAIKPVRGRALAIDVESLTRGGLHACGQFIAGDPRFQVQLARMALHVPLIQTLQVAEIAFLDRAAQVGRRIEIEYPRLLRPNHGPL